MLKQSSLALLLLGGLAGVAGAAPARSLTLADCVRLALEAESTLRVQRIAERDADLQIRTQRSAFFPVIEAQIDFRHEAATTEYAYADDDGRYNTTTFTYGAGVRGLLPFGTSYRIALDAGTLYTDQSQSIYDRRHAASLSLTLTHPLLSGWRPSSTTAGLEVARADHVAMQKSVQARVSEVALSVARAYYALSAARETLRIAKRSLADVTKVQNWVQVRKDAGTASPVELIEAQTAVATRKQAQIAAEQSVKTAQAQLFALIYKGDARDANDLTGEVLPADRPDASQDDRQLMTLLQTALAKRAEIRQASNNLRARSIAASAADNRALPKLDLTFGAGLTALTGNCILQGTPGDPNNPGCSALNQDLVGGHGKAWGNVFTAKQPYVQVGLKLELPVTSAARRALADRAELFRERAREQLRGARIRVLTEVRSAFARVQALYRSVGAARQAATLARQAFSAVETQFKAGLTKADDVLRIQLSLAQNESTLASMLRQYAEARAALDAAIGELPERFNVRVR
ncbi:MAG: TolC family protein [Myxococcales bacterium]|nr:TolC family protein [Myxococcales bacterium]